MYEVACIKHDNVATILRQMQFMRANKSLSKAQQFSITIAGLMDTNEEILRNIIDFICSLPQGELQLSTYSNKLIGYHFLSLFSHWYLYVNSSINMKE